VVTAATVGAITGVVATASSSPAVSQTGAVVEKTKQLIHEGVKKWLEEFVASKRKSVVEEKISASLLPTKHEALAYGVSLAVLTLCFTYVKVSSFSQILAVLPTIFATAIVVELVKNFALEVFAKSRGVWTEHKVWYCGLVMFLVTTFAFGIPFSAPSRNVHHAPKMTKRLSGIVSSAAILISLGFAAVFFALLVGGFTLIGGTGLAMCLIMGLIDAFPVSPMNGRAVFEHSKALWAALFAVTAALYVVWLMFLC